MSRTKRRPAGVIALSVLSVGTMATLSPAASAETAPVDDSVTVSTNTTPAEISVYPQGSSLIGPVIVEIDTVVVDAGDIAVILDTVSLLSQITAPFG